MRTQLVATLKPLLLDHRTQLANLFAEEMGKPITQGLAEVDKCIQLIEYYCEHAEAMLAPQVKQHDGFECQVIHQPLGLILGIMPWNYPLWQIMRFAIPTLLAGNAVLIKPAPNLPKTSALIADIMAQTDLPQGVYQHIMLPDAEISELIGHPDIAGVSLTGSVRAGRSVALAAAQHLKPSVLELGGNDPYIVLADADLALAAKVCVATRMLNAGQVCIAAKRIIVEAAVYQKFIELVQQELAAYPCGDPMLPECVLGPLARKDIRDEVHRQVTDAVKAGAQLLCGGAIPAGDRLHYPATLLVDVTPDMSPFTEEIFGPVVALTCAANEAEAIRLANHTPFGLGAVLFTQNHAKGRTIIAEQLQAGCVALNMRVTSVIDLPFGGIKQSGWGRELGLAGLRSFTNQKTILLKKP